MQKLDNLIDRLEKAIYCTWLIIYVACLVCVGLLSEMLGLALFAGFLVMWVWRRYFKPKNRTEKDAYMLAKLVHYPLIIVLIITNIWLTLVTIIMVIVIFVWLFYTKTGKNRWSIWKPLKEKAK